MANISALMQGKRGVVLGVAGEVHHVDSGYYIAGMKRPDAPDITLAKE